MISIAAASASNRNLGSLSEGFSPCLDKNSGVLQARSPGHSQALEWFDDFDSSDVRLVQTKQAYALLSLDPPHPLSASRPQ